MHSSWHEWIGLGSQNTVVNHTGIQIQEIKFSWEAEDQNGSQKAGLSRPPPWGLQFLIPFSLLCRLFLCLLLLGHLHFSLLVVDLASLLLPLLHLHHCMSNQRWSTFSTSLPHLENNLCLSSGMKGQGSLPPKGRD